jgi:hypothetical protein
MKVVEAFQLATTPVRVLITGDVATAAPARGIPRRGWPRRSFGTG